ncbi:MAG: carboxy terminal-processing peptidase [Bacteroidetes bacterium]|nr:carboxy terminal-processing peptidase [Bacteroidota bacterium]
MSKRFLPVLIILILCGLFVGYGVMGRSDKSNDDPKGKYERILKNIGIVLEQGHYSPKKIDDKFSREAMKKFIEALDPDKSIFYKKDITLFDKYQNRIDDEIHGAPLESFFAVINVFRQRVDEQEVLYDKLMKMPFEFNKNEALITDPDKREYPTTEAEMQEYSRKRLKSLVLAQYVDLQEARQKRDKDSAYKPDSVLLQSAVTTVTKQLQRFLKSFKNHNTTDGLFSTFANSITGIMDPHTTYFAPVDKRSFDEQLSGTFYGIGAQLKPVDGKIKVASLITGMPAWKSGEIKPEDEIIKIGQGNAVPVDITGWALEDAVKLIRGEKQGSEVRLTIKKVDGSIKVVSLLRDKITLEDTYAKSAIITGTHKVGYIRLPEFYADFNDPNGRRSATDMAEEVKKLKAQDVQGIVIDLRGNPGGSLSDVVDMLGLFVKNGPVVQVKGRDEKANVLENRTEGVIYTGPLAVMVDELSASASEIFAAAIQDYHRGIIIGSSSTYGKGTVQRSIPLDPQAENSLFSRPAEGLGDIKLTFRKYYRINGGATQKKGVVSDIIIPDRMENAKFREKDNADALPFDTIPRAKYTLWNPGYSYAPIVNAAKISVGENSNFKGIKEIVNKLDQFKDQPLPLNIEKYKAQQESIKTLSKKLEEYSKLAKPLPVVSIPSDMAALGSDTAKISDQKSFLKSIGSDIYVDETVKIVDQIIGEALVAQNKQLTPVQ